MISMRKSILYGSLLLISLCTLFASCADTTNPSASNAQTGLKVTVDTSSVLSTRQFAGGITLTDTMLNDPSQQENPVVTRVKSLIKDGIHYQNTNIMGWGLNNPWPDPAQAEPSDWSGLDSRLQLIQDTGGTPVITLADAPWWMKGQLQPDGKTKLLTKGDEWSKLYFDSRVLDNKMSAWVHLVQRVAERYMKAPYNVRYFQVWNELKGYYNPISNDYDYETNPGNPSGPNATHGYTFMYNQIYDTLMQTASGLGIAPESIQVGGPYVVLDTWSSSNQGSASDFAKTYGTYDRRGLDAIKYWLQYKYGAGFISLDASNKNRDGVAKSDPFTSAQMFADVVHWIRALDPATYPGATSLPIWWAEWYATPDKQSNSNYDNAVKAYAMMQFVKAGGSVALMWGGSSNDKTDYGIWTKTTDNGGGKPQPWYYSYKALNDSFATGTTLRNVTVSAPD